MLGACQLEALEPGPCFEGETRHVNDVGVSPGVPLVYLNPRTVYNHMDAVIMCSD